MKKRDGLKFQNGQSFVELALVIPVLLMLIAGLVEIGFYYYSYMTALELTREAARFASKRDPFTLDAPGSGLPAAACSDDDLHFYFDTACIAIDTGFNPNLPLDSNRDDVPFRCLRLRAMSLPIAGLLMATVSGPSPPPVTPGEAPKAGPRIATAMSSGRSPS